MPVDDRGRSKTKARNKNAFMCVDICTKYIGTDQFINSIQHASLVHGRVSIGGNFFLCIDSEKQNFKSPHSLK